MKKFIYVGLLLALCIFIAACSTGNENAPVEPEPPAVASQVTPIPLPQSPPPVPPVTLMEEEPGQEPTHSENEMVKGEPQTESAHSGQESVRGEQETHFVGQESTPRILMFDNYDSIAELSVVLNRSNNEIEAYLCEKNLYLNGLENKEDIEVFLATLRGIYFPIVEGAQPSGITVYQGRNTVDIFYGGTNEVRYVFNVSTEPGSAQKKIEANQAENTTMKEISGTLQSGDGISNQAVEFPEGVKVYSYENESDTIQYFDMNVQGDYVRARVFEANDLTSAAKGLQAFDFVKLDFSSASGAKVAE